jgi:hypothetical protein
MLSLPLLKLIRWLLQDQTAHADTLQAFFPGCCKPKLLTLTLCQTAPVDLFLAVTSSLCWQLQAQTAHVGPLPGSC